MSTTTRLPRGRHGLTRDQVVADQRLRLAVGMATAVRGEGYARTSVAQVLRAAGVSRETFYELHTDKLACFLDALDLAGAVLLERLAVAGPVPEDPLAAVEDGLRAYVELLAREPAFARLLLVETFAAGPEAMARRAALQERLVDRLAELLGAADAEGRFALEVLVAGLGTLVTGPLVRDDLPALRALAPRAAAHVRALVAGGLLGPSGAQL